jgi:uncharacterized membrane protein
MTGSLPKCDNHNMVFRISLIFFGIVGWAASFGLTLERLHVAADPTASTSCDISPFISCKSVMLSEQAALLGFPNPLIGLSAYFAPILVGVAMFAGAKFKSWFWQLFLLGHLGAFVFVIWLFTQSAYSIGALCIYCMVAWTATIPLFWSILGYTAKEGHLGQKMTRFGQILFEWAWVVILLNYLIIITLILIEFWDYWPTLF